MSRVADLVVATKSKFGLRTNTLKRCDVILSATLPCHALYVPKRPSDIGHYRWANGCVCIRGG